MWWLNYINGWLVIVHCCMMRMISMSMFRWMTRRASCQPILQSCFKIQENEMLKKTLIWRRGDIGRRPREVRMIKIYAAEILSLMSLAAAWLLLLLLLTVVTLTSCWRRRARCPSPRSRCRCWGRCRDCARTRPSAVKSYQANVLFKVFEQQITDFL